jgi:lycopene beta-cyclase
MPLTMPDVIIVGGGLAGSLLAWRLATERPGLQICVVEGGDRLGGSHTWSFHDTDIAVSDRRWLAPLVEAEWPAHEVRFSQSRRLAGGYASITSARLRAVIAPVLGDRVRLKTRVAAIAPEDVALDDGTRLQARLVIDARGGNPAIPCGWQTFVGQEIELDRDHDQRLPLLMDATVAQDDGYRFVYVLPWTARRLLVEDTLYTETPAIDVQERRARIEEYVRRRGWVARRLVREEKGALPIPLAGQADSFWPNRVVRIGVRAGLFHPTTGYSLPDAVATASLLSKMPLDDAGRVYDTVRAMAHERWSERAFFRMLNRMLFLAAEPQGRVRVLEQFYGRDEALIARFYAGRLSWLDQCRLLSGRPPVPVLKALHHIRAGVQ